MSETKVEVKKAAPARAAAPAPDVWRSFRGEFDRLFERFADTFGMPSLRRMFEMEPFRWETAVGITAPAVDVTEDDKAFKITAELPGLDSKDIELSMSDGLIVLKGEKRQEKEEKEKNYYVCERSFGAFRRAFQMPEGVDRDKIAADFSKGVLTITMPKTAEAQKRTKKIEVKSA